MCRHGACEGDGPECTCSGGFKGIFCEVEEEQKFQRWILAIIITVPFVVCLIIAISACMFSFFFPLLLFIRIYYHFLLHDNSSLYKYNVLYIY